MSLRKLVICDSCSKPLDGEDVRVKVGVVLVDRNNKPKQRRRYDFHSDCLPSTLKRPT